MQQHPAVPSQQVPSLNTVRSILSSCARELREAGVFHIAIIGSVARGDAVASSDIDVLVDLDREARVSLFDLMRIELRLTDIFGRKVDVVSKQGLRPGLDDSILDDAITVS